MDDDAIPDANEMVHAYVISTTKKGCFVRLSRSVEGRVILKELSDDFIPNPSAMFPPGRLVVGKVKGVNEEKSTVDIDMRESVLLTSGDRLTLDDIEEQSKYTGVVSRVESYGVFVRIDNSDVSGLAHVSECSDNYIKNISDLYNPGDMVKRECWMSYAFLIFPTRTLISNLFVCFIFVVVVIKKEDKRLGFSLKASNFVDDDSSDDDSETSSVGSSSENERVFSASGSDDSEQDDISVDSDDENFVSKMAAKMEADEGDGSDSDSDASGSDNDSGSSSNDEEKDESDDEESDDEDVPRAMDTNVGFDWGQSAKPSKASKSVDESSDDSRSDSDESSNEESDDDDADTGFKSSHKARKKAAAKRREEEEISRREGALADGTADENPETSADFERLIASNPNSSEVWIKYMAFHLSLADIDSARTVANRAFERIVFREEGEKLNVWTALLTLELKYGNDKSLQATVDRACKQNNPKQGKQRWIVFHCFLH